MLFTKFDMIYTVIILNYVNAKAMTIDNNLQEIHTLEKYDIHSYFGSNLNLSSKEETANDILMQYKREEMDYFDSYPEKNILSKHFFEFKDDLKNSQLFEWIEKMPKGAALHLHSTALTGPDFFVNLTYWDHLQVCWENEGTENETLKFQWTIETPTTNCSVGWQKMSLKRESSQNKTEFDVRLKEHFRIFSLENINKDSSHLWKQFQRYFSVVAGLLGYKQAFEQYLKNALAEFHTDGVIYMEVRATLKQLYDLDGRVYDVIETARIYERVALQFAAENPGWIGTKIIYSKLRKKSFVENNELLPILNLTQVLMDELPNFVVGFDLVGQEDKGPSLKELTPQLKQKDIPYFFHAGETNQNGGTDLNIEDAILLKTKRLGHAYALKNHPTLIAEVKNHNIPVEVSIISNQVLGFVRDLRNHPISTYFANDLPVVICSDDPSVWGAKPASHDFYLAWLLAKRQADMKLLKQLTINSIVYSEMTDVEKTKALNVLFVDWDTFSDLVIEDFRRLKSKKKSKE